MKKHILTSLAVVVIMVSACQEHLVSADKPDNFSKATGEEIPKGVAERWIERFSKLQSVARIQESSGYNIDEEQLDAMLQTDNLMGIAFHHAIDDQGEHHVLAAPLDNTLSLFQKKYIVDANTNTKMSAEEGERWAEHYRIENPTGIWYHRFGADIFSQIKSIAYFEDFEIQPALNDEMKPQLVLVVKNHSEANGRVNSARASYFDMSNPCPCSASNQTE